MTTNPQPTVVRLLEYDTPSLDANRQVFFITGRVRAVDRPDTFPVMPGCTAQQSCSMAATLTARRGSGKCPLPCNLAEDPSRGGPARAFGKDC